jgi:hypothetical protein
MPARGPAAGPSLLPMYGRELGLVLAVATTELHVFGVEVTQGCWADRADRSC